MSGAAVLQNWVGVVSRSQTANFSFIKEKIVVYARLGWVLISDYLLKG